MRKRRDSVAHQTRSIPTGELSGSSVTLSERLIGVPPDDPAIEHIVRALGQLTLRFGFDPADPTVQARAVETGRREWQREQQANDEWRSSRPEPVHVVYYVRIGQLVKIGTTGQLDTRLRAYPPDAVLLATESGGHTVETERHRQFADTAVTKHGEYFHPSAALIEHINALREQPLTAAELG